MMKFLESDIGTCLKLDSVFSLDQITCLSNWKVNKNFNFQNLVPSDYSSSQLSFPPIKFQNDSKSMEKSLPIVKFTTFEFCQASERGE